MRIVEAKTPPIKEVKITCFRCRSKLAYVENDVRQDRDGRHIACPSCKVFIEVD